MIHYVKKRQFPYSYKSIQRIKTKRKVAVVGEQKLEETLWRNK